MRPVDFGTLLIGVILNAFAQLGLKAATQVTGPLVSQDGSTVNKVMTLMVVPQFWLALAAYGVSLMVWLIGLSRVPVSQAYPLLSMGYVLNIGLAWWLLGEVPNVQRIVGTSVIIAGVVLVARS